MTDRCHALCLLILAALALYGANTLVDRALEALRPKAPAMTMPIVRPAGVDWRVT